MANELLTREDIVRAKQNVNAHDKYLDGAANEKVRLPSGKVIKTRAGIEKEILDKFPDSKAGLREVGNDPGNIPEVTTGGVGKTGLGTTMCMNPTPGLTALSKHRTNGFYRFPTNVALAIEDMPPDALGGVLLNVNYDEVFGFQQYFSVRNSGIDFRLLSFNPETGDVENDKWLSIYHSGNTKPYTTTTATAANVVVTSTGELQRSTSSRLFKTDINEIEIPDYREALRAVQPISYRSTSATADRTDWHWYSFIAEDLANVDPALVNMSNVEFFEDTDEDGNTFINTRQLPEGEYVPDGLNLNGIVTLMARINQYMLEDIEDLEKEKTQLKTRMTKLENRLTELEKLLPAS